MPFGISIPLNTQKSCQSPTICDPTVKQHSGYIDVAKDKHLFYWMFEAENTARSPVPLVMWLNGGPGCSSFSGLFSGVGPCFIGNDSASTYPNPYSWNKQAHLLFLDQPTNVGYSFGARVNSTETAAKDVVQFLHIFYDQFPQYRQTELHVMGESYGGHYVPGIAAQIVKDNRGGMKRRLPLASIAVGNGLYNMATQFQYLPPMACHSEYPPLLSSAECGEMAKLRQKFRMRLEKEWLAGNYNETIGCAVNITFAGYDILTPYQNAGGNPYDVRKTCSGKSSLCNPYLDKISQFANLPDVRSELLGSKDNKGNKFVLCSERVQSEFIYNGDETIDASDWLPEILAAGVRVLNYAGDADLICNWMGNKALMMSMRWPGQMGFSRVQDKPWHADGQKAGELRSFAGLSFLRVHSAGHMVALDQPKAALAMLTQWVQYKKILA